MKLLLVLPQHGRPYISGSGDAQARPDQVVKKARVNFRVRRAAVVVLALGVASRAWLLCSVAASVSQATCVRQKQPNVLVALIRTDGSL